MLLEELQNQGVMAYGFVDDIALPAKSETREENCRILKVAHDTICMPWARAHSVRFSPPNYQLCHITRKSVDTTATMTLNAETIKRKREVKYLRAMIGSKFDWKPHVNANNTKALKTIEALSRLSSSTWEAERSFEPFSP